MKDTDTDAYEAVLHTAIWQRHTLRLRLKHETYQGQDKPKLAVCGLLYQTTSLRYIASSAMWDSTHE